MKEAAVLKGAIYADDDRKAGEKGFNLSTTDWAFMFDTSKLSCSFDKTIPESSDGWYKKYFSDHRPVKCAAQWS